jgi:SAM-dependent methyltransferase
MKKVNLKNFVCTKCGQVLTYKIVEDNEERILQGSLECRNCLKKYPISNGILRYYRGSDKGAKGWEVQWKNHARTRIDKYTGYNYMHERFYENEIVLEAGCGPGSHTEVLLESDAEVYCFDYNNGIDIVANNFGLTRNLNLFQADVNNIPLKKEFFDKICCLGVIQHTGSPKKAFMSLCSHLKPGGEIVVDCYRFDWKIFCQLHYYLRPFIRNVDRELLYKIIRYVVRKLLPISKFSRQLIGRMPVYIVLPIVDMTFLPIRKDLAIEWSINATYDPFSAIHTHPQTIRAVRKWFEEAGLDSIQVVKGFNGIVGKGTKPIRCKS